MAKLGQNSLRVKLNSIDRHRPVLDSHNNTVFASGIDTEAGRKCRVRNDEGMIAGHGKRRRKAIKNARSIVMDACDFSMHGASALLHRSAECPADRLKTETDTEDWNFVLKFMQGHVGFHGIFRPLWAGREEDAIRVQVVDFGGFHLICPPDQNILPVFFQIRRKVVDKRIIIINHIKHKNRPNLTFCKNGSRRLCGRL